MANLKLRYVKAYRDRHGKLRHYFRRDGKNLGTLPGSVGSHDFMVAYAAFLGQDAKLGAPKPRAAAGTFGRLILDYYGSVEFANLKPSSRRVYRYVLEPLAEVHGHKPFALLQRSDVREILAGIAARAPSMANLTRSVLKKLMNFAVATDQRADNPVSKMASYKTGSRHSWTDAEMESFEARWPLGTRERLAYALLLFTGQRGGDVVRMKRSDVSRGAIKVIQDKHGADLEIELHPEVLAALKAYPAKGLTLIGDENGRHIKRATLTNMMRVAIAEAGLPDRCKAHGLRKAIMRRLAERGASAKVMASISGHKTLKEVERYSAAADQAGLARAAMALLKKPKKRT
jgi:integrase